MLIPHLPAAGFGVYVHFPWCRKLCPYCDFAVEVGAVPHDAYAGAILDELARRAGAYTGTLRSIYLGGGTPSLWRPDCIARVIAAIVARFEASPDEVTLEANPSDCTDAHLVAWRAAGITRVSIGVQSLDAGALVTLGRDHRFGDGRAAVARAIAAGFATSADFILGVPGAATFPLDTAPDHLSIYELTIEERTAFGRRVRDGRLVPLPDDALVALYTDTHERLLAAGYEHYEISSYARPGARAVHNSAYWAGAPYLGIGVGAASLALATDGGGERTTNPRRWEAYAAGEPPERIVVTPREMACDRAWLGMRTIDGVARADLPGSVIAWLADEQLAETRGERICPTLRGFLFADRIAARIVQTWV